MYDPELVRPMREELTTIGFQELLTPAAVDAWLDDKTRNGLLVINSVCGCAAAARDRGPWCCRSRRTARPSTPR